MINSVHIKNFESHKDTNIEFSPGVNVFIGLSDNGKSGILRDLYWTIRNRPLGDNFRTWETDITESRVVLDNNIVLRTKGDSTNTYHLNDAELAAFGNNPPEEIIDAFNLNDINIQEQSDPIFLVSSSPGDVAKHFNKIAGLFKIDTSIKEANRSVKETNSEIKLCKRTIKQKEKEEKEYNKWLPMIEQRINKAQQTESLKNEYKTKINKINDALYKLEGIEKNIQEYIIKLKLKTNIEKVIELSNKKQACIDESNTIKKIVQSIKNINDSQKIKQEQLKLKTNIENVLEFYKKIDAIKSKIKKIDVCCDRILSKKRKMKELTLKKEELQKVYTENLPDTCPLCEQTIKKEE